MLSKQKNILIYIRNFNVIMLNIIQFEKAKKRLIIIKNVEDN